VRNLDEALQEFEVRAKKLDISDSAIEILSSYFKFSLKSYANIKRIEELEKFRIKGFELVLVANETPKEARIYVARELGNIENKINKRIAGIIEEESKNK
jgi:hypothetical protein